MIANWELFSPKKYLEEYYRYIEKENKELLAFLVKSYKSLPSNLEIIDVGSGPTVYQLIAASKNAKAITSSDFLEKNLDEIRAWKNDLPGAWPQHPRPGW